MKFKPILPDYINYIMISAIVLMFACHGITHFLIAKHTSVAETLEKAEKVIDYVEQNPLTAWSFKLSKWNYVLTEVLIPGVMFGMYYLFRKKYGAEAAMAFSITAVVVFLGNFINDGAYLLAYLVKAGVL